MVVMMVKVLCGKGPDFWIKEPYTDFEYRMYEAYAADSVRYRLRRGCITEATMSDRDREALANDPVPPFSDKERKRAKRLYPDDHWMIEGETWPPDPEQVAAIYRAVGNATRLMVGHATAPAPAAAAADHPSSAAQTLSASQPAERSDQRRAPRIIP